MDYFAVVVVMPVLLALLCLGSGLLVELLTGTRLPTLLLAPLGFGALVIVSQFSTRSASTAPLTPWLLVAMALLGLALGRGALRERWRARRGGWQWGPLAAVATYGIVASPEILAGHLTFPGYLLDTTGAVQLMGAEYLLHHGDNFAAIGAQPGYGATMAAYFGNGYPSGGHTVLASVGWLSGQDLLWLYSPFQAAELALAALVLAYLAARAGLGRFGAALTGTVAAVPALVFSYALMGSIKEITALPMLLLMGALIVCARELARAAGLRAAIPFAAAAAAALGAIGIAASPWIVLYGAAALLFAVPISMWRRDGRRLLAGGAALACVTALFALPTLIALSKTVALAEGVSASNAKAVSDPGDLLRPLRFVQTLGIWLGESHRVDPRYPYQTYVLIGIVIICIGAGLIWLWRRSAWALLTFVAISFVVRLVLVRHGTEWTDAKLLVLLSPVLILVAMVGAFRAFGSRLPETLLLVLVVAGGVLASDAMAYHGSNMAPGGRYSELRTIGTRFAADRPVLITDFDEYALYLLRKMDPTGPGEPHGGKIQLVPGASFVYGRGEDPDAIAAATVQRFDTIVERRSPERSRPPSNFALAFEGRYYTVWQRTGPAPLIHAPLGWAAFQAAQPAPCPLVGRVARAAAAAGGRLAFAVRPLNAAADLAVAPHSPSVVLVSDLEGHPELGFNGPGLVEAELHAPVAGEYTLWLGGSIDSRGLQVLLDGHPVGHPAGQSGDDGNVVDVATLHVGAGRHAVTLIRGGGYGLLAGNNAGTVIDSIVLEPLAAEHETVQTVAPGGWRTLCGRPLDWVEALSRS